VAPDLWLLWDSSALLPYYVRELATNPKAGERARIIVEAARHHRLNAHFYIPNIVVAEVFAALDRACYSTWDRQVNRQFGGGGRALDRRRYNSARERFRTHIHNGVLFYQYELSRYHILALDLIAPIDKHRKYYRTRPVRSMGASDLLVGAMAMHLTRVHGRDRTLLITTDRRMEAIFSRVPATMNRNTVRELGLVDSARRFGFGPWTPDLYPRVLDLARCSLATLRAAFGRWPLETRKIRGREPRA
jgi:hypothetical protein